MRSNNGIFVKKIATIGGTFDSLHQGHKEYIELAHTFCDYVIIYLSTNHYLTMYRSKSYEIKSYSERYKNLHEYVCNLGYENRFEIRPHSNPDDFIEVYLNELIDENVMYVAVVSPEYYDKFFKINELRKQKGIKSFLLLVKTRYCEKLPNGKRIDVSSGKIRKLSPSS